MLNRYNLPKFKVAGGFCSALVKFYSFSILPLPKPISKLSSSAQVRQDKIISGTTFSALAHTH